MADKTMFETMRKRLKTAVSAYSKSRKDELEDLRFMAGSPDNQWQWPTDVLSTRSNASGGSVAARPCLTINKLPQHVRQVTNDQRQNRPAGKVIPVDDKADIAVAEIFDGMVRHIEYMSDADVAYDTACDNQVTYGEGYLRILTEYCDDSSFDQDIRIGRIRNSFSVYLDPMIQDPCGADAGWGFITSDISKSEYASTYPDATPISTLMSQGVGDSELSQWISQDTIRIAEYFYKTRAKRKLNLYNNGGIYKEGSDEDKMMKAAGAVPLKTRDAISDEVKWVKTNGYEPLEEGTWAGKHIPIIRVVGNEFEIDGEIHVSGLIRNAKDAQRMYNYWCSQEAEMLALAPKAPFVGYAGQFEGYEAQWKTANTNAWPYLEVNTDATDALGNPLPLPQRSLPPMAQTGLIQAKMGASDDIKSTTGQYDTSLGATSNERSGKAILAREKQSDTGTYHYVDNLARAVRYVIRQIVDLIPKVYDTERIARIIGLDGETKMVRLDPQQPEPVRKVTDPNNPQVVLEKIYNLGIGKYDVRVTTGPNYMTKRQEAMEGMAQILQGNKELWAVAGDLFVKNMDWPGAQEMAKRLQKMVDPKFLTDSDESPALQAANQQIQAMAQEMEHMYDMLQKVSQSVETRDLEVKEFEAKIKAFDAETKRIAAVQDKISPDQIQDIVMGTVHGMISSGELRGEMSEMGQEPSQMPPQSSPMAPV